MTAQVWIAGLVGLSAAVDDLRRFQISNWIPAAALVGGFGWQITAHGWAGSVSAALGALLGFSLLAGLYAIQCMGGGDVKLMAGFGALLGPGLLLEAAVVAGLIVVLSFIFIPHRDGDLYPLAPAIVLGAWVALFWERVIR